MKGTYSSLYLLLTADFYFLFYFIYFSGAEAASIQPSMSYETHVHSASQMEERQPFQIGDNAQVVESRVSRANFNNHADESRSSDTSQRFVHDSVAGKLRPEFSGSFTLTKQVESVSVFWSCWM